MPVPSLSGDGLRITTAAAAFVCAWLICRSSARLARLIARRLQRSAPADSDTRVIVGLKRRETVVSIVQTTVRYTAYLAAVMVALSQLASGTLKTVAGASVLVVLIGFAGQRFLTGLMAGFFMLSGDVVRIHNSQILAARTVPRAAREVQIEMFFQSEDAGRELFEEIPRLLPIGPTNFIGRPWMRALDVLDPDLVRLTAGAFIPPGREWLASDLIASLLRERGGDELVHARS